MATPLLALIDLLDGDHVRQSFPVHAGADGAAPLPLRLGRALGNDLVLDDPHLAPEHALVHITATGAQLTLLPSLNGAVQGHRRHHAGEQLDWPSDGLLQLGHTRLRLRHAAAPLAPERPMLHAPRGLGVWLLLLAVLGLGAWDTWRSQEPGAAWMNHVAPLLTVTVALIAWASMWALLQQLFQRRYPFLMHLRRVLVFMVAVLLVGELLPALAFVASAPWLLVPAQLLPALGAVGLVYWHARDVWPRARTWLLGLLLAGTALWLVNGWTQQDKLQHRWREPYLSTLLPPGLRAAPLHGVDDLLTDAAQLREPLREKAQQDENGDADEGDGED